VEDIEWPSAVADYWLAVIVMAITCNADSCIPQIHLYLEMHILGTLIDSPGGPRAISL